MSCTIVCACTKVTTLIDILPKPKFILPRAMGHCVAKLSIKVLPLILLDYKDCCNKLTLLIEFLIHNLSIL